MKAATAELVVIPYPAMGHLGPMVEMARRLIGRDDRLSITVLLMKTPLDKSNITSTTESLVLTAAGDRLKFVHLPQQDEALAKLLSEDPVSVNFFSEMVRMNKQHVRDHVREIMASTESTRLAGFVVDILCTPMMEVAAEFGLPSYAFIASNCAFLGLIFHLETLSQDHGQDVTELNDSDAELEVPVFVNPVPATALPFVADKEGGSTFVMEIARRLRETKGILVNTFEELESYPVRCLMEDNNVPLIYPVGPVLRLAKDKSEEEEEVIQIMGWLDDQPPSSVVFLCFGSEGILEEDQVREIAQALEQCGHRFLWSVRQTPPKGKIGMLSEYQDLSQVLPEGFLKRTTEIGKVIGWAPQVAVLSHKAVGGFVSHCGWNSTLESLWYGVLMATWPLHAEQQMNAFQLVRELGLAIKIKLDYRKESRTYEVKLVTANEIENGIRKLMASENKSSEEIKQKVKEMSKKSKAAVQEGGSSYNYIGRFIEVIINNVRSP